MIGTSWLSAFAAQSKPVFLYSRYFNAEGEDRYSPDTAYKDVLEKLRAEFDVRFLRLNEVRVVGPLNSGVDSAILDRNRNHHAACQRSCVRQRLRAEK